MPSKPSKFIGDDSANIFYGDFHRDIMEGNGGEDVLVGWAGNDRLSGGDGEDILRGGGGDDILNGGNDSDLIFSGAGNDSVLGASGGDFIDGGKGTMDSVAISAAFDDVHIADMGDVYTIATADGIITVRDVELLEFNDGIKTLSRLAYSEPFSLTPGTDVFDGSSVRDMFTGTYDGSGGNITINDSDQLDGGAGSDKLEIAVLIDGSVAPHLENIETIVVAVAEASFAIDLVNAAGVKTLRFGGRTDSTFTAENVSSIVEMQLRGTTSGTLAVEYSDDVIGGDSDTQHVTINNSTGKISVAGVEIIEVVSIASDGQSNRLTIDAADLHTLNIAGDAKISIDGFGANTKVVDASLAIGGIELVFASASGVLVTGGEGDDVFDFSAVVASDDAESGEADFAGAVVDGGEGDDILTFAGDLEGATAIKDGAYWTITTDGTAIKFTNVELLKFADGIIDVGDFYNADPVGDALL